jgi:hypothetical protein
LARHSTRRGTDDDVYDDVDDDGLEIDSVVVNVAANVVGR